MGIRVKATNEDTESEKEMVSAKSLNKNPAIPGTNRIGKNTTSVVKVDTTTGTATSLAPNIEAVFHPLHPLETGIYFLGRRPHHLPPFPQQELSLIMR